MSNFNLNAVLNNVIHEIISTESGNRPSVFGPPEQPRDPALVDGEHVEGNEGMDLSPARFDGTPLGTDPFDTPIKVPFNYAPGMPNLPDTVDDPSIYQRAVDGYTSMHPGLQYGIPAALMAGAGSLALLRRQRNAKK